MFGAMAGLTLFVGCKNYLPHPMRHTFIANLGGVIDGMCKSSLRTDIPMVKELADKFVQFESTVANWTSTYMCTTTCPCPPSVLPSNWTETKLNKY